MYKYLGVKYLLCLSDINENRIFWADFRKIFKYQNFVKIRSDGAELYHMDGRTDGEDEVLSFLAVFFFAKSAYKRGYSYCRYLMEFSECILFCRAVRNISQDIVLNGVPTGRIDWVPGKSEGWDGRA